MKACMMKEQSGNFFFLSPPCSLVGSGGAAIATSELDLLTLSDFSAAFALLAPLSIRPSSVHLCL